MWSDASWCSGVQWGPALSAAGFAPHLPPHTGPHLPPHPPTQVSKVLHQLPRPEVVLAVLPEVLDPKQCFSVVATLRKWFPKRDPLEVLQVRWGGAWVEGVGGKGAGGRGRGRGGGGSGWLCGRVWVGGERWDEPVGTIPSEREKTPARRLEGK